jgi:hypothetical protein
MVADQPSTRDICDPNRSRPHVEPIALSSKRFQSLSRARARDA